jgi:hypothetical protein
METRKLDRICFVTRHFNDLQGLSYWVPLGLITLSVGGTVYFDNPGFLILRATLLLGAFVVAARARRYYRNTFGEVEPQYANPARELQTLSIYSPGGPTPRIGGLQRMSPMARSIWVPLGMAVVLFSFLQATSPLVTIVEDESLVQPPWATLSVVSFLEEGVRSPQWPPHSTFKVAGGQWMYALLGSCFFGIWLGRGRHLSQSYYLAFGILLLGLSVLGASMGYFYGAEGEAARIGNLLLPAVTHLWVPVLICGIAMIVAGLLDHWQLMWVLGPAVEEAS